MPSTGKFSCDSCGKSYSWKPELAGKKAKCKCGQPLRVPQTDPALVAIPDGFDDLAALADGTVVEEQSYAAPVAGKSCPSCGSAVDESAVLCINCGHNLKTGKKLKTSAVSAEVMPGYRSFQMDNTTEPMSAKQKKIIALSLIGGLVLIVGIVLAITIPASIKEKERLARLNSTPAKLEKIIANSEKAGGMVEAMKDGTLYNGMRDPNKERAAQSLEELRHNNKLNTRYAEFVKTKGPLAKTWLESGPKTRIYSFTHDTSIAFIKELEAMGLTAIYCIQPPTPSLTDDIVTYGIFAILPDDPAKRKKIFAWYDRLPKMVELQDVHQDDIGQKYFWIELTD